MGLLDLHYVLAGDIAQINWPPPAVKPSQRWQLWEDTCFEAFLRQPDDHTYIETNASPSGDWHCYSFAGYRKAMQVATAPTLQVIKRTVTQSKAEIFVQVDLNGWLTPSVALQLGLAAVIQTKVGGRLYYALAHIDDKPDFHHRDSHTLTIP